MRLSEKKKVGNHCSQTSLSSVCRSKAMASTLITVPCDLACVVNNIRLYIKMSL